MNKALIAMDKSGSFRVYLAITTTMVEDARQIHHTTALATAALGRVLTGAGLMGLMMKDESNKLTVQFKGDGPACEILATAKGNGKVKGYIANPAVDLPLRSDGKLDVGGAVGVGAVTVIKDLGLKEPYIGRIELVSGEIAEDLTAYFFVSEQQSSSVALGVRVAADYTVEAAAGMVIQMLPGSAEESVSALEDMICRMEPVSTLAQRAVSENAGKTPEAVVEALKQAIFGNLPEEFQVETLEYREIGWECDCSEERLEKALISVGKNDLTQILEEDGQAELVCQFCTTAYHFDRDHLEKLLRDM